MEYQSLLEQQAMSLQLSLTPLERMYHYTCSSKIECCGGVVVKIVSESSADSTISLRDSSGDCFCAVHSDITNTYPDVLTPGALLLIYNATLLVTSNKMPPLLILCLNNLVGLMLSEDVPSEDNLHHTRQVPQPLPLPQEQPLFPQLSSSPFSFQTTDLDAHSLQNRKIGCRSGGAVTDSSLLAATPSTSAALKESDVCIDPRGSSDSSSLQFFLGHARSTSGVGYPNVASSSHPTLGEDTIAPGARQENSNDTNATMAFDYSSHSSCRTSQQPKTVISQPLYAAQPVESNSIRADVLPLRMCNDKNVPAVTRVSTNDDDDDADCLELADDL